MTKNAKVPTYRAKRRLLILFALFAALTYIGAVLATDAAKTREALLQLGWMGSLLVLALSALNYVLRFYRWQSFLARLGRTLPTPLHFLYYLSGFAFTASPAKVGEAFRSSHLRGHGVAYSESLAALFSERVLDLVAMCLLASFMAFENVTYRSLVAGVSIVALALLGMASHPYLSDWLQCFSDSSRHRLVRMPLATLADLLRSSRRLLQPRTAAFGLTIALLSWGAEGLGLFLICQSLHVNVAASTAIGIYAMASLAGCVAFFMPAGIGGTEIVMTSLLLVQHTSLRTAVVATLLCRIATLWFAVLIGVAASLLVEFQMALRPIRSTS
ncbi:MAG: lysylphosphatidylglycerol synthase transmembrane domain-containing protein [Steroidobacteraceae bacterium]